MVVEEEHETACHGTDEQGKRVAGCELSAGLGGEDKEIETSLSWGTLPPLTVNSYIHQLKTAKVREVDTPLLRQEHRAKSSTRKSLSQMLRLICKYRSQV